MNRVKNPCVILTRPLKQSLEVAELVRELGFEVVISPVSEVALEIATPLHHEKIKSALALVVSSQHALEYLDAHIPPEDWQAKPLFVPSKASAAIARSFGARDVRAGEGDAASMLMCLRQNFAPDYGSVLYLRGDEVRVDAEAVLAQAGYLVDSVVCYHTHPLAPTQELVEMMNRHATMLVMLYSARAGAIVEGWVAQLHREPQVKNMMDALCFSEAVAKSLTSGVWNSVHAVARPSSEAMLEILKSLYAAPYSANQHGNM